ncbi:MFS transporter [Litorilinea aerophila]|uniref:MFS transporter n=1 Tax=Litorilinea aerophila TaxID=1204385 RepID=A0A540VD09_9CHLR|nr:MFS transporter [Litorilinea aerophila]MCC9077674.1 MFS transporter [Litorilinea aerophila]GIV79713.1 MAG: MFS transporter [Litorilinea sp.]
MQQTLTSGGYVALVRENRNFRYMWLGQIVSLLGDWFNLVASASLVASLTGSGTAVGGLFVVRMLAPFLVSPLAGVAADRYSRKQLLIVTDLMRGAVVLGFLLVRDAGDIWLLYALTALQLGISGFFFPARNAILPDIVDRGELGAANALSSATWSVMLALGTAIGGLVSGSFGVYPAFIIDALTFLGSALLIAQIRHHHVPAADSRGGVTQVFRQYVDGLRYLNQHRDVLLIAVQKAINSLVFSGGFQVIQVILGERIFVIGAGGGISLGILFAVNGVGTGFGPILARRLTGDRERPLRIAIGVSYLVAAAGIAISAPLLSFAMVLVGMFLRGFGGGTIWVFSTQLLLQTVPDQVRGRVFATEFALFTLANAVSAALVGWSLDVTDLGVSGIMGWMAVLGALPGLLWMVWVFRSRGASRPVEQEPLS